MTSASAGGMATLALCALGMGCSSTLVTISCSFPKKLNTGVMKSMIGQMNMSDAPGAGDMKNMPGMDMPATSSR